MNTIQAVTKDNPALLALCGKLDAYLNLLAGGEEQRRQYILLNRTEDLDAAFLALQNGIAVGCAGLKHINATTGEVKRVFVAPAARRQGIGTLLMNTLEEEAKKRGYSCLILETGAPLKESMRMYARHGYEIIPAYGQYAEMEASSPSICMGKRL